MLRQWNPIEHLFNDLNLYEHTGRGAFAPLEQRGTTRGQSWTATDLFETPEALIIKVDVPGLRSEDLSVTVKEHVLTIDAERTRPEFPEGTRRHEGRRYGAFKRSYRLAPSLDAAHTKAEVNEGVLSIVVPKVPESQAIEIEVL